ncbi:MAG: GNAT family N-acetyltransferase [Spirochaetales bacterium]|jgi:predicted acetyltransferase|nr:GNAT family N-acetyltransferase [Spirochaetales bacterium]
MEISLVLVKKKEKEKEILKNLSEKYSYEISQYLENDVNALGLYNYWDDFDFDFDYYWSQKKWRPYFIKVDKKLAGFVLITNEKRFSNNTKYFLQDFFVMYKYRRMGVGTYILEIIFEKFKGKWELLCHHKNNPARIFWRKNIKRFSNNNFKIIKKTKLTYIDGSIPEGMIFEI